MYNTKYYQSISKTAYESRIIEKGKELAANPLGDSLDECLLAEEELSQLTNFLKKICNKEIIECEFEWISKRDKSSFYRNYLLIKPASISNVSKIGIVTLVAAPFTKTVLTFKKYVDFLELRIHKYSDEWYYVDGAFYSKSPQLFDSSYYKCDGIFGLFKLIETLVLEEIP